MLTVGRGKAMEEEKRDESSPIPSLPIDLIVDILSQLPVKSLVRFKCVSKSWLTLFTDPCFVKMHLNRSHKRKKLVFSCSDLLSNSWTGLVFSSDNTDKPTKIHVDSRLEFPAAESVDSLLEFPAADESVSFMGSCDGLILCLTRDKSYDPILHLVNPSTREFNRLPNPPFYRTWTVSYGFGYDASSNDYKVVEISNPSYNRVVVYSLKTNSWRRIQDIPYQVMDAEQLEPATLLNGALHWLTEDMRKIVAFDLAEEKFQDFLLPHSHFETTPSQAYLFSALRGCLGVCFTTKLNSIYSSKSWVMEEYGKTESWTDLGLTWLPNHLVRPFDYSNNDEILFVVNDHLLYACNPEKNTYRDIKIPYDTQLYSLQYRKANTFLETIVSPSHHT